MTTTAKVLVPAIALGASNTLYTCAVTATIVDKITMYNTDGTTAAAFTLAMGAVLMTKTLQPLESYTCPEVSGHILVSGDTIASTAAPATITCRMSGREVT